MRYGFIAAGYTTLFCYLLLYLLHYLNVKRRGYDVYFANKRILVLSATVVLASIVLNFAYNYTIVRYGLIAIIIIVGMINKKTLVSIIKGVEG